MNTKTAFVIVAAFLLLSLAVVTGVAPASSRSTETLLDRVADLERRVDYLEAAAAPGRVLSDAPSIRITSPPSGASVGRRVVLEGATNFHAADDAEFVALVRPSHGQFWVQRPVSVQRARSGDQFRCGIWVGSATRGRNEQFEVLVVLAPRGALYEGAVLRAVPAEYLTSASVVLTRH